MLVDGGVAHDLDYDHAVHLCRERVESDSDIIVDSVFLTGESIDEVDATQYDPWKIAMRVRKIMSYNSAMGTLEKAKLDYPQVHFRYTVVPSGSLNPRNEIVPIRFDHDHMEEIRKLGVADAVKEVS